MYMNSYWVHATFWYIWMLAKFGRLRERKSSEESKESMAQVLSSIFFQRFEQNTVQGPL